MKKTITLAFIFFCISISIKAQNTTFNDVSIGIDYPTYGAKIKTNFPGYNGPWGRAYFIANETGEKSFFTFASVGESINGVSTVTSNFIGKDIDTRYMTFLPNGNIGIGTTNPRANFDMAHYINNGQIGTVFGRLGEGDDVGSGTFLGVQGHVTQGDNWQNVKNFSLIHNFYGQTNNSINFYRGSGKTGGFMTFCTDNNSEQMRIAINGNIGIGTTNPTSKLTVAGNISSREVRVTVDAGADFVFENDYNLPPLGSVEQFIKKNKHLPEIASAEEMQKEGINLSEMNIKLLQKIEEMTLYMIEQNKLLHDQQKEIIDLKKDNKEIKNRLLRLKIK